MSNRRIDRRDRHDRRDKRDRRRKHRRRGIDGAFNFRCCFVGSRYQVDFSNVTEPCVPEEVSPFLHCGC
ncbi:hypothetical protein H1D32_09480 [Anaerobacillus sp. CMMVII]|uniref:hypothetical protein n=1 Tax=Anaerobacillus sp. CMMVII TaxID=2755588 RepID=UPI0021B8440B|nr:hypothetical protein [Anaerobacillus sp. CMMVII]MCT8137966.1 hypothetical protein [Anaerobacillus sp. CMMVII]